MTLECELVKDVDLVCELETGGAEVKTQSKTVTPTAEPQTVYPDAGYYLSSVQLTEPLSQSKTVVSAVNQQTVLPDEGYLLSSVTVDGMPTETASVTPTEQTQTVTPSEGKLLSEITVEPIPSQYHDTSDADGVAADLMRGKIMYGADGRVVGTSDAITPTGTVNITSNGTHDVTQYAEANVNIPVLLSSERFDVICRDVTYTGETAEKTAQILFGDLRNAVLSQYDMSQYVIIGIFACDSLETEWPVNGLVAVTVLVRLQPSALQSVYWVYDGVSVKRENTIYTQYSKGIVEQNSRWRVYIAGYKV